MVFFLGRGNFLLGFFFWGLPFFLFYPTFLFPPTTGGVLCLGWGGFFFFTPLLLLGNPQPPFAWGLEFLLQPFFSPSGVTPFWLGKVFLHPPRTNHPQIPPPIFPSFSRVSLIGGAPCFSLFSVTVFFSIFGNFCCFATERFPARCFLEKNTFFSPLGKLGALQPSQVREIGGLSHLADLSKRFVWSLWFFPPSNFSHLGFQQKFSYNVFEVFPLPL